VSKFLDWAEANFLTEDSLYSLTSSNPTPTPYAEGPLAEANQVLCEPGQAGACARARQLAEDAWRRFEERIDMGPQFDTIYLHWMLVYSTETGDPRWSRGWRRRPNPMRSRATACICGPGTHADHRAPG
jgi:hypothetical protein